MHINDADRILEPQFWAKNEFRHGLWRAKVVSVNDPEARGRVQVRVLLLHHEPAPPGAIIGVASPEGRAVAANTSTGIPDSLCPWAEPAFPWGSVDNAFFATPKVGSLVWVGFDGGFTGRPVWLGAWLRTGDLPAEITNPANIRLMKTPAGGLLLFDDTSGAAKVILASPAGSNIRFVELNDATGRITIKSSNSTILLEAGGNVTIENTGNLTVNTTGNIALGTGAALGVMLESFIALFNAHTHPETGGTTGPPSTPAVAGTHSSATVKAKV